MYFITFIFKNLSRRRGRSALTALGIAISVGAMVALLSIADRFTEASAEAFEKRGVDLVVLQKGVPNQTSSDLDERLIPRIRALPGVAEVSGGLVELLAVQRGDYLVLVQGWPPDDPAYRDLKIIAGRRLGEGDRREVMLGAAQAENLKKKVGDEIEIVGVEERFKVVGIFESFVRFETGGLIVPLTEMQKIRARPHRVTGIVVMVAPSENKPAVVERIRTEIEALTDEKGKPIGLSAKSVRDYVADSLHLRLPRAMAWLVSTVAVLVGAIGMLNTMTMSVLERVAEIGILRAVGWPKGRIVRMVLGESLLLGLVGAIVGVVGAVIAVRLLVLVPRVNGFIDGQSSPRAIVEGLAIALVMGVLGGAYPAYRAAKLTPLEALRHE